MTRLPRNILCLQYIQILSLSAFYVFNFIDRGISNIFLLLVLILCLIDYKRLYVHIKEQILLITTIILFSVWISFIGIYHQSPMNELDNYYRFLLLIPLLMITVKDHQLVLMLNICALGALGHLLWTYLGGDFTRFQGTSSNAITYANLCALFFIMCIYFYFINKHRSIYLLSSGLVFFIILVLTQTRGPLIGIMLSLLYLVFYTRSRFLVAYISIAVITLIFTPNPLSDKVKLISKINLEKNNDIYNFEQIHGSGSINQRVFYLQYGLERLKNNLMFGIGPHHLEREMLYFIESNNINMQARDHLHNDFLDISVKFGIPALILLVLIYFALYKSSDKDNQVMMNLILIMLMSSQLTQSQFAHHQAITFFIVLAYLVTDSKLNNKIVKSKFKGL